MTARAATSDANHLLYLIKANQLYVAGATGAAAEVTKQLRTDQPVGAARRRIVARALVSGDDGAAQSGAAGRDADADAVARVAPRTGRGGDGCGDRGGGDGERCGGEDQTLHDGRDRDAIGPI